MEWYRKIASAILSPYTDAKTVARAILEISVAKLVRIERWPNTNGPQFVSNDFVTVCSTGEENNSSATYTFRKVMNRGNTSAQ